MKIVAFSSFTPSPFGGDMGIWASLMFHGYARRRGAKAPGLGYFLSDRLECHLHLTHCSDLMPDVIDPSNFLLLSGRVKDLLAGVKNVKFLKVEYEKVFSVAKQGKRDIASARHEEEVFDAYRHQRELLATSVEYFELIPARVGDLVDEYETTVRTLRMPKMTPIKTRVSRDMLATYPILWDRWHIFSDEIFNKIEPYLDRRCFRWKRVVL